MKVVCVIKRDFPDKNDPTKRVQGATVYYLKPCTSEGGSGFVPEKIFLNQWLIENRLDGKLPEVYPLGANGMPTMYDDIDFTYRRGRDNKAVIDEVFITKPTK